MPLAKCSSADISEAVGAKDLDVGGGRIVLAESLVFVEAGVLPRGCSCSADVKARPLGPSSDFRIASTDGRGGNDDVPAAASLELSILTLPMSMDGLVVPLTVLIASSGTVLADELEGRVGGDGGVPLG